MNGWMLEIKFNKKIINVKEKIGQWLFLIVSVVFNLFLDWDNV